MSVLIGSLDWRAGAAIYVPQLTQLNTFMATRTFQGITLIDEIGVLVYNNTPPVGLPTKFNIFNILNQIETNGIPATQTLIENFLAGKTLKGFQHLDDGAVFLWYE